KLRLHNPWLDGKAEKVDRGDLIIPVSASGTVTEDQKIELKSKANGRIMKVRVKEGEMISAGQVVMEIDPIDENRNVARLQAGVARAKAAYEQALIRKHDAENNRPLDVKTAEQLVKQAKAQRDLA